jgi:hypothetical protein
MTQDSKSRSHIREFREFDSALSLFFFFGDRVDDLQPVRHSVAQENTNGKRLKKAFKYNQNRSGRTCV